MLLDFQPFDFKENEEIPLPVAKSWPKSVHVMDNRSGWALNAALAAERPLLIMGEPGCGKSQLARAAAVRLNRAFVSAVVHARADCQDLQYSFDAVARLGEAQTLGPTHQRADIDKQLNPLNFLSPGPLWWAFDWISAEERASSCRVGLSRPWQPEQWEPAQGCVVLIDEIDKAESDLPNGLLETLGNGSFTVPYLDEAIGRNPKTRPPLVVITTNQERDLPHAFLRRCLVLKLNLPTNENLIDWLLVRGRAHFSKNLSEDLMRQTAELLLSDRETASQKGLPKPGLAEYLDLLRALLNLGSDEEQRFDWLTKIREFALVKYEEQDQL